MTTLTSVLNYGALISLSCCNAVLQIAGGSVCADFSAQPDWPACAPDGVVAQADVRSKLLKSGRVTRLTVAEDGAGSQAIAYVHVADDEVCLWPGPNEGSRSRCGSMEVSGGRLYMVEADGQHRRQVERIDWQPG
jgi:hypothetical protein